MSSVSIDIKTSTSPVAESSWKKAGRFLGYAVMGVSILLAGAQLYNSYKSGAKSGLDTQSDIFSQLETVAKTTTDLCKDKFFGNQLCKGNLGIPRIEMPQVGGVVLENYLQMQASHNVSVENVFIHPSNLTSTQNEMHSGKVLSIVKSALDQIVDVCSSVPILAARNWVVDGHHRFAACSILNRAQNVIRIDKSITAVLDELKQFPGVIYQGLKS